MTNDDQVEKHERPRPPELIYCRQLVEEIIKRNAEMDRPLMFRIARDDKGKMITAEVSEDVKDHAEPMTTNGPLTEEKKAEVGAAFLAEMETIKGEALSTW